MKKSGFLFALMMALVFGGCAGRPMVGVIPGEEDPVAVGLYRLRPLDPVIINLLGIPQEKQIDTALDEKGRITIPYIDEPITAAGMTTSELEREIQQIYIEGKIYKSITANVMTSAKIYYLEGEVERPMQYSLTHKITLLEAIAAASGYTEFANRKNITITRRGVVLKYNGKELEKHPERDVPIEAGDRIKVHRTFY